MVPNTSFLYIVRNVKQTPAFGSIFFFFRTIYWRYGETLLHLESIALESIQDFLETIQHYNGQAFDPEKHIHLLTTEIMSELVKTIFSGNEQ